LEITLDVDWRIFSGNLEMRKGTGFTTMQRTCDVRKFERMLRAYDITLP